MTDPWKSLEAKLSESGYADEREVQMLRRDWLDAINTLRLRVGEDEFMRILMRAPAEFVDDAECAANLPPEDTLKGVDMPELLDKAPQFRRLMYGSWASPPVPWYARLWRRLRR